MIHAPEISDTPIAVVGGIVMNNDDQIFLCKNRQGFLVLPGGKIDATDSDPVSALQREISEELNNIGIPRNNIRPHKTYSGVSPYGDVPIEISTYMFSLVEDMECIIIDHGIVRTVVNTKPDDPEFIMSGEIHGGEFYTIEEALEKPEDILGSATRDILDDIQTSRKKILEVAVQFQELQKKADKDLVGKDRERSMELYYEEGGVLGFTPELAQEQSYKKEIESLIAQLPENKSFTGQNGGRLGDMFLFGKKSHEQERRSIYYLLMLGTYIDKTESISQISELQYVGYFQDNDVINNVRFKILS